MIRSSCLSAVAAVALVTATAGAQQPPLTFDQAAPVTPAPNPAAPPQPTYGQPPQGAAAVVDPAAAGAAVVPGVDAQQVGAAIVPGAVPQQAAKAPPAAPFQLTEQEANYVVQTLKLWEQKSAAIITFKADFERLEYDKVWGPATKPMIVSNGTLTYKKPDKGSFKIDKISRWTKTDPQIEAPDAPGDWIEQKDEIGEHWVCDGANIYEYEQRLKQLRVTTIPPQMRGQGIVDGPLPFLFGAEANKLMERYWIRPMVHPDRIWLQAFPKRQVDAANYDSVEVMLDPQTMHPTAIQVNLPGGQQRHVYTFQTPTINGKLDRLLDALFGAPDTPPGWNRVVMNEAELQPGPQASNPAAVAPR